MIEKLTGLLRLTARNLEELSGATPSDSGQEAPVKQPAKDTPSVPTAPPTGPTRGVRTYVIKPGDTLGAIAREMYGSAAKYNMIAEANNITDSRRIWVGQVLTIPPLPDEVEGVAPVAPPPPSYWQRFSTAERERFSWLRRNPLVVGITLGLAIAVVIGEKWLIMAWGWLTTQVRLYWPILISHPVALIAVVLALIYLVFGLNWLRYVDDFIRGVWRAIKERPRLSVLVGGTFLIIALWIANNYGTWIVLPFSVGQTESTPLNGETVAAQLIAELNQVGVGNPTPVLVLWELQEPRTSSGRVTAHRSLPLEDCDTVLQGPGSFTRRSQPIPLSRVLAGSQGSRLDLGNLSIGGISIPSQILTQFLTNVLPTGYREFSGQISESDGEVEISISSKNPSMAWRIAGANNILPEMLEYLALRIALDLNPELIKASGLDTAPSDRDLAFAMGNQAFREQRYRRAYAFYQLADHFASLDEKVDVMLGLSSYQLASEQGGDDPARFGIALQAMEAALNEDPNGESSLLRPYLACLYHKSGMQDEAEAQRAIFNRYLRRLEFQDIEVRVDALKQAPLRGPGRHLAGVGNDVIFVDGMGNVVGAEGRPLDANLLLFEQNPRQIGLYGDSSLLLISADGALFTYDYATPEEAQAPKVLIEGRALRGVQQIDTSPSQFDRTNLFLLNREGEVYWCEPDAEPGSLQSCPPRRVIEAPDATQIFALEDQLYILATDGAVWRTDIGLNGRSANAQPLTPAAPVQEIFVADDNSLYLLHNNGNVWRYYDDSRAETEDLKLIDQGIGTDQIFAAGNYLYLLKSDGAIWRISNPRNPNPDSDLARISMPPQDTTIQEIFITVPAEAPGSSDRRILYLLTDQRVLLRGLDTGEARVTFEPVAVVSPEQMAISQ
jgi:LysM repeat protein